MSILIINRFSKNTAPYYDLLKEKQVPIVMLCDQVREGKVENEFDVLEYFTDWRLNGNIERRAIELHETYQFRQILAFAETDLIRAAKLRELLGIPDQSVESAIAFRNKVKMKTILQEAGIKVPTFKEVLHPHDLIDFCKQHGFPVVYKPVDGAGSENTFVLKNEQDMAEALQKTAFLPYEVETFIPGEMYHVDGVWKDGQPAFIQACKYINGSVTPLREKSSAGLNFKLGHYLGSFVLDEHDETRNRLIEYTIQVLQALPTPVCTVFHAEVFVTPEGELVFCEIACRAGGGRVVETYRRQYGFHLIANAARGQCGLPIQMEFDRTHSTGWVLLPPHVGEIVELPDEVPMDWVIEYLPNAKVGDRYDALNRSVDCYAQFIVKGDSMEQVEERLHEAARWIETHTKWKP